MSDELTDELLIDRKEALIEFFKSPVYADIQRRNQEHIQRIESQLKDLESQLTGDAKDICKISQLRAEANAHENFFRYIKKEYDINIKEAN